MATIIALALTVQCGGAGDEMGVCEDPITDPEAVALAEEFVRANGYTLHDPDRSQVVRGTMDGEPLDELLARRRGMLKDSAVGYSKRGDEWIVAFSYTQESMVPEDSTGLGVVVDKCGESLSMPHETVSPYEMETLLEARRGPERLLRRRALARPAPVRPPLLGGASDAAPAPGAARPAERAPAAVAAPDRVPTPRKLE